LDQQKILGYFIEEAKEHLQTLERGILELSSAINDQEQVNEMFRAAHSIKGGAAMLGYNSIQKIAHRLEDSFKVLREHQIAVDQQLESLFLKSYDVLHDLIEKLQSPFGLAPDEAEAIVEGAHPNFIELQAYLNELLCQGVPIQIPADIPQVMQAMLSEQIRLLLKQLLLQFKEEDNADSRQSLQQSCHQLAQFASEVAGWQSLVQLSSQAIANPNHGYRTLAPVVIRELKRGSDLLELNQRDLIMPSPALTELANAPHPYLLVPLDPEALAQRLRQSWTAEQITHLVKALGTDPSTMEKRQDSGTRARACCTIFESAPG
jgi:chemotaxis protein histidine kinase CheA